MLEDDHIKKIETWKKQGLLIAYSQGVFDLLHEGHIVFLSTASKFADRLIVGVDSDQKVRLRKGPRRPVDSFEKRVKGLLKLKFADLIFKKENTTQKWVYLKDIKPDFWIVTCDIYNESQLKLAEPFVNKKTIVLPRLPTISTTQLIFKMSDETSTSDD